MTFLHEQSEIGIVCNLGTYGRCRCFSSPCFPACGRKTILGEVLEGNGFVESRLGTETEAALKPWITFEGKAPCGLKAERTPRYVTLSNLVATGQPVSLDQNRTGLF
jgi:hypothetical protein